MATTVYKPKYELVSVYHGKVNLKGKLFPKCNDFLWLDTFKCQDITNMLHSRIKYDLSDTWCKQRGLFLERDI